MNRIIPFAITEKAFEKAFYANPSLIMDGDIPILGNQDDYEPRPAIDLTEAQANMSPQDIAEIAWITYQNIDKNRRSPDSGRSMMIGDLVLIELEGQSPVWLTVAVMGFKDVSEHMKDWTI